MSEYTFLELEVDSDAVATVLDALPGVAVVDDISDSDSWSSDADTSTRSAATRDEAKASDEAADSVTPVPGQGDADETDWGADDDDAGLTDRLVSLWQDWGLLGVGCSLIALGAATAGLWWYRRRGSDNSAADATEEWASDSDVDTPAPSAPDRTDAGRTDSTADGTAGEPSADEQAADASVDEQAADASVDEQAVDASVDEQAVDASAEGAAAEKDVESRESADSDRLETHAADTYARTDRTDRTDQWRRSDTADAAADSESPDRTDADTGAVDMAPLLGFAFLVITSAVQRWVQQGSNDQR